MNVFVPIGLYEDMKKIVEKEGKWMSEPDFIREAVREKIERWKKEHAVG